MGDSDFLLNGREKRLLSILTKFNKTNQDLIEDVTLVENWLRTQKNLPEVPDRNFITNFLLLNKFQLQKTKKKIEAYYLVRISIPELFENKHPSSPHMRQSMDIAYYIPLPQVTDEGYRVCINKIVDDDPKKIHVDEVFASTYNVCEVRLHEDVTVGEILVYDLENVKIGHFFKLTIAFLRKITLILENVYGGGIKQIHLINTPTYASTTISIVKQLMKQKLARRIHIHKDSRSLSKFIPLDILPCDYGGKERSLLNLNELWKRKLEEYKERFDFLEEATKRTKIQNNSEFTHDLLGINSNFRSLNLD